MTYEHDDADLIRKLLSSSRGTIIDVSISGVVRSEVSIPSSMLEAISNADYVWLMGLPNKNESGTRMWVDFDENLVNEASDVTRAFLETGDTSEKKLRISFSQTEQIGLAFISLERGNRRIMFGLNKTEGIFVSSFQTREGRVWVENELRQDDGLADDLSLVIRKAKQAAGI